MSDQETKCTLPVINTLAVQQLLNAGIRCTMKPYAQVYELLQSLYGGNRESTLGLLITDLSFARFSCDFLSALCAS